MTSHMSDLELEKLIRSSSFNDSDPDLNKFWRKWRNSVNPDHEEVYMPGKKGGFIVVWVVCFIIIAAGGWFGLTKYSEMVKLQKIDKGEAIVVSMVVGDAEVKNQGATVWKPMAIEDTLQMGDTVRTAADSYCELQMVKRGVFRIESSSEVYLATLVNENDNVNSKLKLDKGQLVLKPNKLKTGDSFQVETSTAVAAVRGTRFSVGVNDTGDTTVAVDEGAVSLQPVIPSIDAALTNGKLDQTTSQDLKNNLIKPVIVSPGQQASFTKTNSDNLNSAVSKALDKISANAGGQVTDTTNIVSEVKSEVASNLPPVPQSSGSISNNNSSLEDSLIPTQKLSDDSAKILNQVSADMIMSNASAMYKIDVNSDPEGAELYIDGVDKGITPSEIIFEKGKQISIKISKDGYSDFTKDVIIDSQMNINAELTVSTNVEVPETNTNTVAQIQTNTNTAPVAPPKPAVPVVVKKLPGELDWEKPVAFNINSVINEPVIQNGRIYVTENNRLVILSTSGRILSSITAGGDNSTLTKPEVSGNLTFAGSDTGDIYSFNEYGKIAWTTNIGTFKYGAYPVAAYGMLAVPVFDKGVILLSTNGKQIGLIDIKQNQIFSAPIIINSGKDVIYALESGDVVDYNLSSNSAKWTVNVKERVLYPLVGEDGVVVVLLRNSGSVIGINTQTGATLWTAQYGDIAKTQFNPVYSHGKVILANYDSSSSVSYIYIIDSQSGKLLTKTSIAEKIGIPDVADNSVYISSESGKVYSYNIDKKQMDWIYKAAGPNSISLVIGDENGVYALSPKSMIKVVR